MYELQKRYQLLKSPIMYQYVNCIDFYINKQDGSNEPNQRLMLYNDNDDNNNNNKAS